ncbi:MAG: hypothetical protein HN368_10835 [Spirochaetales bacterium]|nr:hypothetical protein [Spirochaetales bacterium]
MSPRLPEHPDIEHYRKEAKSLLKGYRTREESALLRLGSQKDRSETRLADAQKAVAREAGFSSWAGLKLAIEKKLEAAPAPLLLHAKEPEGSHYTARKDKQKYESDANVQRWLKLQGSEDVSLVSSFLSNHHERDWIMSSLGAFHAEGRITVIAGVVKAGKEATVYRCLTPDNRILAAKVYRPRMFRNLQNDALYRENRHARKDRRSAKAMNRLSRLGRSLRMESWIQYEFDTLVRLYKVGADVPEPIARHGNAILMEYIGDESGPAPMLLKAEIDPADAPALFERLISNVELIAANGFVHADLSPYNILYWERKAWIIDFAQSVDLAGGPEVYGFLTRDIEKICLFFKKFGIESDPAAISLRFMPEGAGTLY